MLRKFYLQQQITRVDYSTALLYRQFRKCVLRSKSMKVPFREASTNYKTKGITTDLYASHILEHLWDQFEMYLIKKDPNILAIMEQITGFKEWGDISQAQIKCALKLIRTLFKAIDLPAILVEHVPKSRNQKIEWRE